MPTIKISFILVLLTINNGLAETLHFSSQKNKTHLLELYSSQGCSSCPPAERWISGFSHDETLWSDIVPIVFHVDYWNDLGWRDPFSQAEFSKRQRHYQQRGHIRSVYTPGFILNGKEWRKGQVRYSEADPGIIKATLNKQILNVEFSSLKPLELNAVILGFALKTNISRGENINLKVSEDFVALSHQTKLSHTGKWQINLNNVAHHRADRYALAIWLTEVDNPTPIQATGVWLTNKPYIQ